jgi:hypothetical protein
LLDAMAKIEISIYTRCIDATIWDFLNKRGLYSNCITHRIFMSDFIIEEIAPFLF